MSTEYQIETQYHIVKDDPYEFDVQEESADPSYYAMIPHMAMLDLDPYALALYCQYKKVIAENPNGKCYMFNKSLAKQAQMSVNRMKQARAELEKRHYIRVIEHKDENGSINRPPTILLRNIWAVNKHRCETEYAKKVGGVSPHDRGVSPHDRGGVTTRHPLIRSIEEDEVKEDTKIKNSLAENDLPDVGKTIPEKDSDKKQDRKQTNVSGENETSESTNGLPNTHVPPVGASQQKKPKTERVVLPKVTQELIGKYVMNWEQMGEWEWKQVNNADLAKYLAPKAPTEDELKNFREWYGKKYPGTTYAHPNVLLNHLAIMRSDIASGKFHLQESEASKPKITIGMKEAARRAKEQGISIADVYRQIDPTYLSPEEKQQKGKS